ncbi:MAG: serpin family protein [Gemmatimonadota bacterium]|nr:MAG: serpin family protein [Gemmatimonadota bacterium]
MSIKRSVGLFLVMLLASGCAESSAQQRPGGDPEGELARAGAAFGFKLLQRIHSGAAAEENIFISPLSVAAALGMVYNGAAGATEAAIRETLELGDLTSREVNEAYRELARRLVGLDPAVEFLPANSIWYLEGFEVKPEFLYVNGEYYGAEVAALDFASPSAAPTINDWVNDNTNGRIADIVDDPIERDVLMYLINAVYFNGDWTIQFDAERTADRPFHLADGSVTQVPMMTYPGPLAVHHFSDADAEAIDLPYGGDAFAMTVVMPGAGGDIGALVQSLDSERWQEIVSGLAAARMNVLMPKFTLEYELEMSDVLATLGMGIAFTHAADFSKICDSGLLISRVKHKAFVDVNERGTEAAAVTAVELKRGARPAVFAVDRPFVFAIRERSSGTVLFLGVVMTPGAGQ